jgi:hypothetical protein
MPEKYAGIISSVIVVIALIYGILALSKEGGSNEVTGSFLSVPSQGGSFIIPALALVVVGVIMGFYVGKNHKQ